MGPTGYRRISVFARFVRESSSESGIFSPGNVAVAGLVPRGESVPAEESGIGAGCGGIPEEKREGITESRKKP